MALEKHIDGEQFERFLTVLQKRARDLRYTGSNFKGRDGDVKTSLQGNKRIVKFTQTFMFAPDTTEEDFNAFHEEATELLRRHHPQAGPETISQENQTELPQQLTIELGSHKRFKTLVVTHIRTYRNESQANEKPRDRQ